MSMPCKHCRRQITETAWPVHIDGPQKGKHRCWVGDTGQPYGFEAHEEGTKCVAPCIGEVVSGR